MSPQKLNFTQLVNVRIITFHLKTIKKNNLTTKIELYTTGEF